MRGGPALAVILALALAAGCRGERVAECDAMLAVVERVGACGRLDATQRAQIDQAVRAIRDALDRLEDVGPDRAPADLLNETKVTCARQEAAIRQVYEKDVPECLR
jgi:hypothetical protein